MTTLYGISFVGHAMFQCHIFLIKCFYDFFFSSLLFVLVIFLWASGLLYPTTHRKKEKRNKEKTNPSKLQRLQTINVKFHYPELQAELLVLLSLYSCHIYIVLSFDFLHPNPFAPRNKLFSVLCAGESCLIVGLPFWRFSAPRKYDTYPLMHHL